MYMHMYMYMYEYVYIYMHTYPSDRTNYLDRKVLLKILMACVAKPSAQVRTICTCPPGHQLLRRHPPRMIAVLGCTCRCACCFG